MLIFIELHLFCSLKFVQSMHIEITTRIHSVLFLLFYRSNPADFTAGGESVDQLQFLAAKKEREIPELSNPQDLVQMLENIQGRLLGWHVYIKKSAFIKFLREEVILQASLCHIIIFVFCKRIVSTFPCMLFVRLLTF